MKNYNQVLISISALGRQMHELVNQEKQKYGLTLLMFDPKLAYIARGHSKDMAQRNLFSHQTPERKTPTDRGTVAGYNSRKNYGNYYTYGLAKNIFMSNSYHSVRITTVYLNIAG